MFKTLVLTTAIGVGYLVLLSFLDPPPKPDVDMGCRPPNEKEIMHMALDGTRYVCSYTRWREGQWGLSRVERKDM